MCSTVFMTLWTFKWERLIWLRCAKHGDGCTIFCRGVGVTKVRRFLVTDLSLLNLIWVICAEGFNLDDGVIHRQFLCCLYMSVVSDSKIVDWWQSDGWLLILVQLVDFIFICWLLRVGLQKIQLLCVRVDFYFCIKSLSVLSSFENDWLILVVCWDAVSGIYDALVHLSLSITHR